MGNDKYENGSPQELRKENALLYIILCKKRDLWGIFQLIVIMGLI